MEGGGERKGEEGVILEGGSYYHHLHNYSCYREKIRYQMKKQ
jgi:hypothetical protein